MSKELEKNYTEKEDARINEQVVKEEQALQKMEKDLEAKEAEINDRIALSFGKAKNAVNEALILLEKSKKTKNKEDKNRMIKTSMKIKNRVNNVLDKVDDTKDRVGDAVDGVEMLPMAVSSLLDSLEDLIP